MFLQKRMASRMRREMAVRHLTVEELSQTLGIAKSSAQDYLRERGNPRADTIELIYGNLGLSLEDLLRGGDGDFEPDFYGLLGRLDSIHPKLYPLLQSSYRMALVILDISDELYRAEANSNDS